MIAGFLFRLSLRIRHHPLRFLFGDFFFNLSKPYEDAEVQIMRRDWNGDVWDVGASVGKYTPILAKSNSSHKVYAFEPNLNSLYFLGYRTANLPNVVIVAAALTEGAPCIETTFNPDFNAPATGPLMAAFSVEEAIQKFGKPAFIKMDIEGAEFEIFRKCADLFQGVHMLVEWHPALVNKEMPPLHHWKVSNLSPIHTFLEPR